MWVGFILSPRFSLMPFAVLVDCLRHAAVEAGLSRFGVAEDRRKGPPGVPCAQGGTASRRSAQIVTFAINHPRLPANQPGGGPGTEPVDSAHSLPFVRGTGRHNPAPASDRVPEIGMFQFPVSREQQEAHHGDLLCGSVLSGRQSCRQLTHLGVRQKTGSSLAAVAPDAEAGIGALGLKTHEFRLPQTDGKHRHRAIRSDRRCPQRCEPVADSLLVDVGDVPSLEGRRDPVFRELGLTVSVPGFKSRRWRSNTNSATASKRVSARYRGAGPLPTERPDPHTTVSRPRPWFQRRGQSFGNVRRDGGNGRNTGCGPKGTPAPRGLSDCRCGCRRRSRAAAAP